MNEKLITEIEALLQRKTELPMYMLTNDTLVIIRDRMIEASDKDDREITDREIVKAILKRLVVLASDTILDFLTCQAVMNLYNDYEYDDILSYYKIVADMKYHKAKLNGFECNSEDEDLLSELYDEDMHDDYINYNRLQDDYKMYCIRLKL